MKGALALLFFALAVPAARAQTVAVYASADSVRVGEPFALTIVARHGVLTEAVLPDTGRAFAGAEVAVLEKIGAGTRYGGTAEPGTRVDSAVYRVAAFALDTLVVPPIAVGFVQGADTFLVPTPPYRLRVAPTAPTDADALQPARARMDVPLPLWVWLLAFGGVALAVLALYLLLRRLRRRAPAPAPPAPALTPAQTARQRLAALERFDLEKAAQVKPYYVELTEALRQYIEVTTGIPALEQTSAELVRTAREAAQQGTLPAGVVARLADLFAIADFAKFADGQPPPSEGVAARQAALAVVDEMEAHRAARQHAAVQAAALTPQPQTTVPEENDA